MFTGLERSRPLAVPVVRGRRCSTSPTIGVDRHVRGRPWRSGRHPLGSRSPSGSWAAMLNVAYNWCGSSRPRPAMEIGSPSTGKRRRTTTNSLFRCPRPRQVHWTGDLIRRDGSPGMQLRKTKNNYEFLVQVSKTTPGPLDRRPDPARRLAGNGLTMSRTTPCGASCWECTSYLQGADLDLVRQLATRTVTYHVAYYAVRGVLLGVHQLSSGRRPGSGEAARNVTAGVGNWIPPRRKLSNSLNLPAAAKPTRS